MMTTHGTGSIPSLEFPLHYTLPTSPSNPSINNILRISMYIKHIETSHAYTDLSPPISHFFPTDPHPSTNFAANLGTWQHPSGVSIKDLKT